MGLIGARRPALAVVADRCRGGEIVALYEAAHVDVLGATVVTLAQLAYLPDPRRSGRIAFVAGPGFAVGNGHGRLARRHATRSWFPVSPSWGRCRSRPPPGCCCSPCCRSPLGALAGWIARSRLVAPPIVADAASAAAGREGGTAPDLARTATLNALLAGVEARPASAAPDRSEAEEQVEPIGARAVIAIGIAVSRRRRSRAAGGPRLGVDRPRAARRGGSAARSGRPRGRGRGAGGRVDPAALAAPPSHAWVRPRCGSATRTTRARMTLQPPKPSRTRYPLTGARGGAGPGDAGAGIRPIRARSIRTAHRPSTSAPAGPTPLPPVD